MIVLTGSTLAALIADRWSPTSLSDLIAGVISVVALISFWFTAYFAVVGLPVLIGLAKKNITVWPRSLIMGFIAILPLFLGPGNTPAFPILFLTGMLVGATCIKPSGQSPGEQRTNLPVQRQGD